MYRMTNYQHLNLQHRELSQHKQQSSTNQCLFQASFWGVSPSPKKAYNFPPNGWQTVCSKSFLAGTMNYQYHGNFLLMDNKHGKLSVIKQSKRRKFMSKMHQNTTGSRALPGTAGEAYVLPRSPSHSI